MCDGKGCTPIAVRAVPGGAFVNIAQDGGAHFVKVAMRDIPPGIRRGDFLEVAARFLTTATYAGSCPALWPRRPCRWPTTHLDIKFPADDRRRAALVRAARIAVHQTLCQVNDSVRLGVMQGEYHWHKHDRDDEFFFVLEGHFVIDLEDRSVVLQAQEGFVVPKGVMHRTRAPERAVILMVETAAIVPTGDA